MPSDPKSMKDWPAHRDRMRRELRDSERLTGEDMATRVTPEPTDYYRRSVDPETNEVTYEPASTDPHGAEE